MTTFKPKEYVNLVDNEQQMQIYKYLTSLDFPWHFLEDATTELVNIPQVSTPCFCNLIYYSKNETNPHYEFFKPLIDQIEKTANLKITELLRIRAGFLLNTKYTLPSQPYKYNPPHKDYDEDHYVAIYYVNEADGETIIFSETESSEKYNVMHRCMPLKGKLLLFNGKHFHSSTCPKIHTKRIVLTINFKAEFNG